MMKIPVINTSRVDFFSSATKNRKIILRVSLGIALAGVILGISIAASLFELSVFLSLPGSLLVKAYGGLAFLIPVYLFYSAFVLADPHYRPDRIFILFGFIIPFFTVALGCYILRDFDDLVINSLFLARAGKLGTGFLFTLITVMELMLLILLRSVFFVKSGAEESFGIARLFLPAPKYRKLKDIYTEAAAAYSDAACGGADAGPAPHGKSDDAPELVEQLEQEEEENEDSHEHDVERALAEAEEAAARHGSVKDSINSRIKAALKTGAVSTLEAGPVSTRKRRLPYGIPIEGILSQYPDGEYWIIDDATRNAALTLKETLKEFNIQAEVTGIRKGPVITMFEILPAPGVKLSRIVNLQDNIALRLAASSVRIVAPIPGKHAVGIEVPNAKRNIVSFREIIEGELLKEGRKPEIPIVLGKDITGEAQTIDLAAMPHLLIAGATGSGKSVCINSMILSILYQKSPAECRLILIDPKIVELKLYNDIPHLLTPVITEPKRAFQALQYCICEMERRYACLDSMSVRDIRSYNKRIREQNIAAEVMPYIIVVIDEFADLMATTGKELESTVARLAAMSRAIGIHLVLATQRPSIDVITGLIKANIPSRIAFMVAGRMNSQIIIDSPGAEKLLGRGDMLYSGAVDPFPIRMQGAFISEEEVERTVDYVKTLGEPDYIDDEIFFDEEEDEGPSLFTEGDDPLYDKALEIVCQQGKASASFIQRRLKIGYNRAARLVEEMEHNGVVGPAQGSKPRELLKVYSA